MVDYILGNLIKVAIGAALFCGAYVANMGLGAWRNVKLNGHDFDWRYMLESVAKFVVLALSISVLTIVVTVIPMYVNYVGIELSEEVLKTISSLVIIGSFLIATIQYVRDGIQKVRDILSNGATMTEALDLDELFDKYHEDTENMITDEAQVTQRMVG